MSGFRRVLLLGTGYTTAPLVEHLTRDGTVAVTVGKEIEWNEGREREWWPECLGTIDTIYLTKCIVILSQRVCACVH